MNDNTSASISKMDAKALRKIRRLKTRKRVIASWQLYVFLIVPVIYYLLFHYYPLLGAQIAFRKYKAVDGIWGSQWVGLYQFKKIFTTPKFFNVFINTITLSGYSLLLSTPITIIFALCLNAVRNKYFKKAVQMITYMPHFISTVIMVGLLMQILNPRIGLYGQLAQIFGLEAVDLFSKAEAFPHIYVLSNEWQNLGWSSVIYLSALSSVDTELYDASQIDGASRVKQLIHIDFPCILPTAVTLLILHVGKLMNVGYEKILLMQNPLNLSTSEIISTYSYKVGLQSGTDYSYGAAIGLLNSVVNFILLVTVNKISKKVTETSLW